MKAPLEGRVWYDYPGQSQSVIITSNTLPAHIGRVLDEGTTQLYTYGYNPFGHVTNSIDPLGRTFSYIYDTNGIDLLEVRQTRSGNNELLAKATYNSQHRPLTVTDAAGQTTTYSYNARGQILTMTDPKNETVKCTYDANGYLVEADGPLPGTNDTVKAVYDGYGRVRSLTDVSGYVVTLDYDNLDRVTRITHPDGTSSQYYITIVWIALRSRTGRDGKRYSTHDNMRQLDET